MKKFRNIAVIVLAFLLAFSAQASSGVIQFSASEVSGSNVFAGDAGQNASSAVIPSATLSPEAAALPWNLTLVNSTHPVPDNWNPELMELSNGRRIDVRIYPELQAMFDACRAAGLKIQVNTAYRSLEDQKDILMSRYKKYKNQGMGHEEAQIEALKWASYPGYSEHHLGLAVDINSSNQEVCSNDRTWNWLKEHCAEYGFIWRYPGVKSDITGISNEDWHFRYVGKEAAQYIMSNQLCLEEYLEQQYGIK